MVGFEVLTAVSSKMAVFWVVAPCCLVEVYQRFRGTCSLHHQGPTQGLAVISWGPGAKLLFGPPPKFLIILLDLIKKLLINSDKFSVIALMMEAARTSEMLVNFYQTTQQYNPEDNHLPVQR
jgi:hypothetical protein